MNELAFQSARLNLGQRAQPRPSIRARCLRLGERIPRAPILVVRAAYRQFFRAAAARTRYLVGSDGAAFNGFAGTAAHGVGA